MNLIRTHNRIAEVKASCANGTHSHWGSLPCGEKTTRKVVEQFYDSPSRTIEELALVPWPRYAGEL